MKRFLQSTALFGLLALVVPAGRLDAQQLFRFPFTGAVTESSATVAVWLNGEGTFRLEYGIDPNLAVGEKTPLQTSSAATDNMTKVVLTGLAPATRFYYRVLNGSDVPISAIYSFKTFPEPGSDAPITILFGSCQQSRLTDSGPALKVAAGLGGEFFVHMGDWSYPDRLVPGFPADPGTERESYAIRLDTAYPFARDILSQMGLAYVWDDHDFYEDNADGTVTANEKEELLSAYRRYMPHYPLPNESAGLWHSFRIGNVEFFMVDARTQRSPVEQAFTGNTFAPPPGHSMLAGFPVAGIDQRAWLMDALRNSTARWKVLVSPVFFNPGVGAAIPLALLINRKDIAVELADKWVGYPADVDSMKALFNTGYGKNVLVISGDAHTNLYDNGSHSLRPEFMVGNLDQRNSNLFQVMQDNGFNPWTAGQPNELNTVGRIRVETTPRHRLIVESFDETGAKLLSLELEDNGPSSVPVPQGSTWRVRSTTPVESGGRLQIEMENAPAGEGTLTIFDVKGTKVSTLPVALDGGDILSLSLPRNFPAGAYLGRMKIGSRETELRFVVIR